jgi:putative MATE family efflux protein
MTAPTNDLTTAPVGQLVRRLAIPASVGFFFNTMYNVVDTFWAGKLSTDALAALSLSFPVFFVLISLGSGFSTGATALIGDALGAGDRRRAACLASQGLLLGGLVTVAVMGLGYASVEWLFRLLGATDVYLEICLQYMHVILAGSGLVLCFYMLNGILNAQGDTRSFRDYLIGATLLNLVLDPWFMYGGFGLPAMGVRGIALATLIAQGGGIVFLAFRVRRTGLLRGGEGAVWRPRWAEMRAIVEQGIPASGNMMTVALGIFVITWFLKDFGQAAVAAYGVATRIEQIALMPTIGLNVAALTLAAQNGGAGRFDRVRQTMRTSLAYGAGAMVFGSALIFFAAEPLMRAFTADPVVVGIGAPYLRLAAFIEFAYVILFVNTSALQGLKKPAFALWIGLYRQIIAPFAVFWLAAKVWDFGLFGIWWGIFFITWSSALVAVWWARRLTGQLERDAVRRNIAAAAMLAVCVFAAGSVRAAPWWPSTPGSTFTYLDRTVVLTGTETAFSRVVTRVSDTFVEDYAVDKNGDVVSHGWQNAGGDLHQFHDPPVVWLDLPLVVGKTWSSVTDITRPERGGEHVVAGAVTGAGTVLAPAGPLEALFVELTFTPVQATHLPWTVVLALHEQLGPVDGLVSWTGIVENRSAAWGDLKAAWR